MKNLFLFLLTGLVAFSLPAQTSTEFETEAFDEILVSHRFDVTLEQSSEFSVTAEAPKELLDEIDIRVENGELIVSMKDTFLKNKKWKSSDERVRVHITFPKIDELELSGAVKVTGVNALDLDAFEIEASGASEIILEVKCTELEMELSGASDVTMIVNTGDFDLDASGASEVNLTGSAGEFSIDCSGASDITASEFQARSIEVNCSGASNMKIWASEGISVHASGHSEILYKCDSCDDIQVNSSGTASVKKY